MNNKTLLFVTCMAYLTLGQFIGNVIFIVRTWYLDPSVFTWTMESSKQEFVLVDTLGGCNGEGQTNYDAMPQKSHLRGKDGNDRRFLNEEESPSSSPLIKDPRPPTYSMVIPGDYQPENLEFEKTKGDGSEGGTLEIAQTSSCTVNQMLFFVIGFASCTILLAGCLVFSGMRDRCKGQDADSSDMTTVVTAKRKARLDPTTGKSVSGSPSVHGGGSVFMLPGDTTCSNHSSLCYEKGPDGRLYPVIVLTGGSPVIRDRPGKGPSDHISSEKSLSGVSDMTSLAMESVKSSRRVTALSDSHRVPLDTSLVNLAHMPASAMSTSSQSTATVSIPTKESLHTPVLFKHLPEQHLTRVSASDFDAGSVRPRSVMSIGHIDDSSGSVSEEDESGWTSSAGGSDSSAEVSIGTMLKSVCSIKSQSSARSVETGKSSFLFGESLNTSPEKFPHPEGREDGNSMELSVDGSDSTNESRAGASMNDDCSSDEIRENEDSVEGKEAIESEAEVLDDSKLENDESNSGGNENDMVSEEDGSTQLGQFLEKSKGSSAGHCTECSVATSKSPSLLEGSVVSGADSARSSIRSVKLVPMTGTSVSSSLGIEVKGSTCPASNPVVTAVEENSPAADRLFVGDVVLAVNDMDTTGWDGLDGASSQDDAETSKEGEDSVEDQSILLTVMSAGSDGSETGSTSSQESIQESSCSLYAGSVTEMDV